MCGGETTAFADVCHIFLASPGGEEVHADRGWPAGEGSEDTPRITGPGELLSLSLWSRGLRVEQLWRVERMK